MNNGFKYQPAESYYEEEQRDVRGAAQQMESYNPMEDDGDLPYIPSLGVGKSMQPKMETKDIREAFVDINNMHQYTSAPKNSVDSNQKYQQTYSKYQMEAQAEPSFTDASKKFGQMRDILSTIGQLQPDMETNQAYAIEEASKSIRRAIEVLQDVQYWLPKGKEEYAIPLERISQPIVKALSAYAQKIDELK